MSKLEKKKLEITGDVYTYENKNGKYLIYVIFKSDITEFYIVKDGYGVINSWFGLPNDTKEYQELLKPGAMEDFIIGNLINNGGLDMAEKATGEYDFCCFVN